MTTSRLTNTNTSTMQHYEEEDQSQKSAVVYSEVHFETLQGKRRLQPTPDSYMVKFRVTVVFGVPVVKKKGTTTTISEENAEVDFISAAVKVNSHYHVEYCLMPGDEVVRTDVLLMSINVAKIFPDRGDPKLVKTWVNNDVVWVAWSHTHGINMTVDRLVQLYKHKIEIRVWDTRDTCTSRAKFERPRSVKAKVDPPAKPELGDVRSYVFAHSEKYKQAIPKPGIPSRPLPTQQPFAPDVSNLSSFNPPLTAATTQALLDDSTTIRGHTSLADSFNHPEGEDVSPVTARRNSRISLHSANSRVESHVPSIASIDEEQIKKSFVSTSKLDMNVSNTYRTQNTQMSSTTKMSHAQAAAAKKAQKAAEEKEAEQVRKAGRCSLAMEPLLFFSNIKSHTVRLDAPVNNVSDAYVTVDLETPLFDQDVAPRLNPLTIKIVSVTSLPKEPVSREQLASRCHPIYCKYRFLGQPEHRTPGGKHDEKVYWNDVKVILAGYLDPVALREYFASHPLEIEVHDRDRLTLGRVEQPPALFGLDHDDEQMNRATYVSSKRIVLNDESQRQADFYGVARLDLSCLLEDLTSVTFKVPVVPAAPPNVLQHPHAGAGGDLSGVVVIGENSGAALPPGDYIGAQTTLKVLVNLVTRVPSVSPVASLPTSHADCPFARVVFVFKTGYPSPLTPNAPLDQLLNRLLTAIREANVRTLGLEEKYSGEQSLVESALETYKLDEEQKASKSLDVITGALVTDNQHTVVLIEGLRDFGVACVLQAVPKPQNEPGMTVLFNTSYPFSTRLYTAFDCVPLRVRLLSTFDKILEQPLVFIRHMIPTLCVDALRKLSLLVHTTSLQDAVRNDLLPSSDQLLALNQEFGVPFEKRFRPKTLSPASFRERSTKLDELTSDEPDGKVAPTRLTYNSVLLPIEHKRSQSPRRSAPLENRNETFEQTVRERASSPQQRDFVRSNLRQIRALSRASSEKRSALDRRRAKTSLTGATMFRVHSDVAFNYSGQKRSSTEMAKAELRKIMQQHPNRQFAYSPDFMSASFEPIDPELTVAFEAAKERAKWKTAKGFVFPGQTSSMQDNAHPKRPDIARLDALREPWVERDLWAGKLKPTLEYRDRFGWQERHADMDVWKPRQKDYFGDEPVSMFISSVSPDGQVVGEFEETHAHDLLRTFDGTTWLKLHRRAAGTEQLERGPGASSQMDKLAGLLKDKPQKLGLKVCRLSDIPPVAVVTVQSDAERERDLLHSRVHSRGSSPERPGLGYTPGPYDKRTLSVNQNVIPRANYDHDYFSQLKGQDFDLNAQVRPTIVYKGREVFEKGREVLPSGLEKPLVSPPPTRLA